MTDKTFTEHVNEFMDYSVSIMEKFEDSDKAQRQIKIIQKIFNKYDDEKLIRLFATFFKDTELTDAVQSFNYSRIVGQSIEIPVSGDKKPQMRLGYLYRKAEELDKEGTLEGAHLEYMSRFLKIAELSTEGSQAGEFGRTRELYNRIQGKMPESNQLIGIIESIPGANGIINGFLKPELIKIIKETIVEVKDNPTQMNPDKIRKMVDRVLDRVPEFASFRPMITNVLESVVNNPATLEQLKTNPQGLLMTLGMPLLGGMGGSGGAPKIDSKEFEEALNFNPYE